jgi:hypothetical protein
MENHNFNLKLRYTVLKPTVPILLTFALDEVEWSVSHFGAFSLRRGSCVPVEQEDRWKPDPVWKLWRRVKVVIPTRKCFIDIFLPAALWPWNRLSL